MRRPAVEQLPEELRCAAAEIARVLAAGGHRAWIVGGAVRDLALERAAKDVDMASDATPEEVEALFAHTVPLGRAFGTLLVRSGALEVQHTSFRSEHGYSDTRRPDRVRFGRTLEEDASRRDFTCNALYLDPLNGELCDPTNGLDDLERGRLRCVGDARARFGEDGLRILRLARFAGSLALEIEPDTFAAARESRAALAGVSPERTLAELDHAFAQPGGARMVRILVDAHIVETLWPRLRELHGASLEFEDSLEARVRALELLEPAPGLELGLAALFDPDPEGSNAEHAAALGLLDGLRASRATRRTVERLWHLRRASEALGFERASRAVRLRVVRDELWPSAARLAHAFAVACGRNPSAIARLTAWRAEFAAQDLFPPPLASAADLEAAGVARGPQLGALLSELETEQLEGRVGTREQALRWIAERARSL